MDLIYYKGKRSTKNFFFISIMESGVLLHPISKISKTYGKYKGNNNSWFAKHPIPN